MANLGLGKSRDSLDFARRPLSCFFTDFFRAIYPLVEEFLVFPAILEDMPQHSVDGCNVSARSNPDVLGCVSSGPCHARIHNNHVGSVELFALKNVLQRDWMCLGGIPSHEQYCLGAADIVVAVRHGAVAPCVGYASNSGRMADAAW